MARNRYFEDEEFTGVNGKLVLRMLSFVKPYSKKLAIGTLLMLITTLLTLIAPFFSRILINDVYPSFGLNLKGSYWLGLGLGDYYTYTYSRIALLVACAICIIHISNIILGTLRHLMLTKVGYRIINDMRQTLFNHLQKLSFKYFDDRPAGKILVRVTSYIDALAGLLSSSIVQTFNDLAVLLGIIVVMLIVNPMLTLISLLCVTPLAVYIIFFRRIMFWRWRKLRNLTSNRTAFLAENISGLYTIQAYNRVERNWQTSAEINQNCKRSWLWDCLVINNTFFPAIEIVGTLCSATAYFFGYRMITGGTLTPGDLIVFTSYIGMFWGPINNLSAVYNQLVSTMSNAERIFETIDTEPDIIDAPDATVLPEIKGEVRFENVTFSYEKDTNVLEDLSFTVLPGQMIALVGPTGAGKTTVVNLLSRFYDATEGNVLIDGYDLRGVTMQSLRRQVGVMMQDTFIFSGTIMDNIRYGRLEATDEECISAAKAVHAHEFISHLPDGYHTVIGERGAGLSTGERQLLSFARTILSDPKILILDEATSSIDTYTEQLIQKALSKVLMGRTSFVIAHRLSTIMNADRIMYISDRGIAEAGTHEQLLEAEGLYAELYKSQFSAMELEQTA